MKFTDTCGFLPRITVALWLIVFHPGMESPTFGQFNRVQEASEDPDNEEENKAPARPLAEGEKPPSLLIEIPDEPRTIDPVTVMPPKLTTNVTVRFTEKPLKDIVKWIQEELSLNVIVDYAAITDAGLLAGEPITDHSDDAPLYLLLNRLEEQHLAWFYEDETLYVTTKERAEEHFSTIPYNLGDLFDAGFRPQATLRAVETTTGSKWEYEDGEGGTAHLLGDVIFIRQTDAIHFEIAGLFAALRKHGRRTFISDPPQHETLRQKLNEKVTVDFDDVPLGTAIEELGRQASVDLRLAKLDLNDAGISDRTPVSLKITDRPLNTVLRALLAKLNLTWVFRNGVLQITTMEKAEELQKTAVFDVRDLCRSRKESTGLMQALHLQTGGKWEDDDGEGGAMASPQTGVLIVRNTEQVLDETLKLLENYRAALRISKPRVVAEVDPKELITRYYRMEKLVADDLQRLLVEIIEPESWKTAARPDATGTIRAVASTTGTGSQPYTVLIIRQTRENQVEISKLVNKVQFGDATEVQTKRSGDEMNEGGGMGGMGGGMGGGGMGGGTGEGGFGGGFFAVPSR